MSRELENIEEKIKRLEAEKLRIENRQNTDKRKQETRLKIQIGGLLMKRFQIETLEDAEKLAIYFGKTVNQNRDKWQSIVLDQDK